MAKRSKRARNSRDNGEIAPRPGSRAPRDEGSWNEEVADNVADDSYDEEPPVKRRRRRPPVRDHVSYDEYYDDRDDRDEPPRRRRKRPRVVRDDEYEYDVDYEYDYEYDDRPPAQRERRRRPVRDEGFRYDEDVSDEDDREVPSPRTRRRRPARSDTEWEENDFETKPSSRGTTRRKSSSRATRPVVEETPDIKSEMGASSTDPQENASDATEEGGFHFFRTAVLGLIMILIFAGVWYYIQGKYEPEIISDDRYDLANIVISPEPPPWILDDIVEDTRPKILALMRPLEDTDDVSLLEDELCQRSLKAFEDHHWVTRVLRVQRRPDGLYVELKYRRPACIVLVPGGLFLVDGGGAFLPEGGFISEESGHLDELALAFPLLTGVGLAPKACLAGDVWRDIRVQDGARIASELGAKWLEMRLYKIVVSDAPQPGSERYSYRLVTKRGTIVLLGTVPEIPPEGMANLETKIQYLIDYADDRDNQLDRLDGQYQQEIDLSNLDSDGNGATLRPIEPTPPSDY